MWVIHLHQNIKFVVSDPVPAAVIVAITTTGCSSFWMDRLHVILKWLAPSATSQSDIPNTGRKCYLWGIQSNFMTRCFCFPQRQALKRYLFSYRNVTEIWSLPGNRWLAQGTRQKENKCSYENLRIFPLLLSEQYNKPHILWQTVKYVH